MLSSLSIDIITATVDRWQGPDGSFGCLPPVNPTHSAFTESAETQELPNSSAQPGLPVLVQGPPQASAWELGSPLAEQASADLMPPEHRKIQVEVHDSSGPCARRAPADREDREDRAASDESWDRADHGAWGAPDEPADCSCSLARAKDLERAFRTENGNLDPPE